MFTTSKKSKLMTMTQFDVDSSYEKKADVLQYKQSSSLTFTVIILCFQTWYFGYCLTYFSTVAGGLNSSGLPVGVMYPSFPEFIFDERAIGPCMGLIPFGAAVGVIICKLVMNRFNRRDFLISLNILNLIFTGLLQIPNVVVLFVFRFMQGVLVGNYMTLIPEYIGELTPKQMGSRYGVYPQVAVVLGVLVSYLLGVIYTDANLGVVNPEAFWRLQFVFPVVPSLLQFIFMAFGFLPESPTSLLKKNRRKEAKEVIALYNKEEYIDQIVEEKENQILNRSTKAAEQEQKLQYTAPLGYILGYELAVYQCLCGIASFVTQTGHVISVSLNQPTLGLYTPIIITVAQLIGTFISIPLLRRYQWRTITLIGGFILCVCDALVGVFLYEYTYSTDADWKSQTFPIVLSMVFISIFMLTFGITFGSSIWPYINFTMPSYHVTIAAVINWFLAGVSLIGFSLTTYYLGSPYIMLWIYAGITFILTIYNVIQMIPIQGLTFKKVQMKLRHQE